MGKFRKKPVVIDANQWFNHGDHYEHWPKKVVHLPDDVAKRQMGADGRLGWVDTLEGGHVVTPGDWIIIGVQGEMYPCKPDIFETTYDPEEEANPGKAFADHLDGK